MFTGIHKHTIIGTMVAALALAAPAFGVQLPDGYEMQSAESSSYSPQALQALNGRWEATARFHEQSTGYSPQALQALNERWEATARFHEESTGYTPQALQALGERGQAMGQHYGQVPTPISNVRQIDALERAVVSGQVEPGSGRDRYELPLKSFQPVVAGDDDSFAWDGVGIVAGSAFLLAALAGAALLGMRTRGRVAHP
jgi:hypothetical protein